MSSSRSCSVVYIVSSRQCEMTGTGINVLCPSIQILFCQEWKESNSDFQWPWVWVCFGGQELDPLGSLSDLVLFVVIIT